MAEKDVTTRLCQPFRDPSSSTTFTIDTRFDSKTGQYVIRWKDILQVCKNAEFVKDGDRVISFMVDDDLEDLLPLRIAYHAGAVLDIFSTIPSLALEIPRDVDVNGRDISCSTSVSATLSDNANEYNTGDDDNDNCIDNSSTANTEMPAPQLVDLSMTGNNPTNTSLVSYFSDMTAEGHSSLLAYNQLYGSLLNAIQLGQQTQVVEIKTAMDVHFDQLQLEMDKNKSLQIQLLERQQEIHQLQQNMKEKQDEMLDIQQQTLNHLSLIQNRLQAIFNQNYELHEYPIPRLFIVLPKPQRLRDQLTGLVSHQFRLFFLCECGTHTMTATPRIKHEIHLAKHEGYDIKRPTEFFQKYGPRVLKILQWLRYGIAVAGVVVPTLAHLKLVEGIDEIQNTINAADTDLGPMLDQSIKFIEDLTNSPRIEQDLTEDRAELEKLEVLEGADLRQLESFLKVADEARSLANLYRIVTHEGHVKWVCIDHYRENYRDFGTQQLREFFDTNGDGHFIEEEGKIKVRIRTRSSAKQFYIALVNARGIQELDIHLRWDVTLDDLRTFADVVTKANILRLQINGAHFEEGPLLDTVNNSRRFNPLIQLVSNGRLQFMRLHQFKNIHQRISESAFAPAIRLRVLHITTAVPLSFFSRVLQTYTSLVELKIEVDFFSEAIRELASRQSALHDLRTVEINNEMGNTVWSFGQNRTIDISLSILKRNAMNALDALPLNHLVLLRDSHHSLPKPETAKPLSTTRPMLMPTVMPRIFDKRLMETVGACSRLSTLEIDFFSWRHLDIIQAIRDIEITREQSLSKGGPYAPLLLSLILRGELTFKTLFKVQFPGASEEQKDMSISVHIQSPASADVDDHLAKVFRVYGPLIQEVDFWDYCNDQYALLLYQMTSTGSNLTFLRLDTSQLSTSGINNMIQVITHSAGKLVHLGLKFTGLDHAEQFQKAERFIRDHGALVSELALSGNTASAWIPKIQQVCGAKGVLPVMDTLVLVDSGEKSKDLPQDCSQWIFDMVSTPQSQLASTTPNPHINIKSLRKCTLRSMELSSEDWIGLFSALDFSTLESLSLGWTNINTEDVEKLIECIPEASDAKVPLEELDLSFTPVLRYLKEAKDVMRRLLERAPLVDIKG
ncbi:hypothetical protein BGZ99_007700 [Dissophora globulifera]|uniref:Uncharacterized protein n=1 Tax=Dissophora globulifera TaxID=979702 RepID=A0A9P6RAY3_9FUNG|nr:hypothetical protein BGZ99_007700 [Dissophora globulifera]